MTFTVHEKHCKYIFAIMVSLLGRVFLKRTTNKRLEPGRCLEPFWIDLTSEEKAWKRPQVHGDCPPLGLTDQSPAPHCGTNFRVIYWRLGVYIFAHKHKFPLLHCLDFGVLLHTPQNGLKEKTKQNKMKPSVGEVGKHLELSAGRSMNW